MAYLVCSKSKGHEYWRIAESKRVGGKVVQKTVEYIGNRKKLAERVLGNNACVSLKSYSCGDSRGLMAVADKYRIVPILGECLGAQKRNGIDRATSLLLAAIHRAADPGSKSSFSRWFETTSLPRDLSIDADVMTSQHFWEQMDDIDEGSLAKAEDMIAQTLLDAFDVSLEKLALDYTNYYTYIATSNNRNTLAQRGNNKQKRHDLRQYSLAIVTSKDLKIPLFSYVYAGNTNDRSAFSEYTQILENRMPTRNASETTLIFDGGSNTKENLRNLPYHYIASFSLASAKELYGIDRGDYEAVELGSGIKVDAYRLTKEIWGEERICILTLSDSLFAGQIRELDENIDRACAKLDELKEKLNSPKSRIKKDVEAINQKLSEILKARHVKEVIGVTVLPGDITYVVDNEKKSALADKYFGKKLLVTDHEDWTTKEIIESYREQDAIEKIFRDSKDDRHSSMQPVYHWTDQKIRVHVFICLLGLTLVSILHKEVTDRGIKISRNRLLDELSQIREGWIGQPCTSDDKRNEDKRQKSNISVRKVMEDMTPLQSQLWEIVSEL